MENNFYTSSKYTLLSVSYTHLDVYKRQAPYSTTEAVFLEGEVGICTIYCASYALHPSLHIVEYNLTEDDCQLFRWLKRRIYIFSVKAKVRYLHSNSNVYNL